MKGIIFTEFLDFVESRSGYQTVDRILTMSELQSGGIYTAVGSYHFSEMVALLSNLVKVSGKPAPQILKDFGKYLFSRFVRLYPHFFRDSKDPLDFIETIEAHIHMEVLKLYPDAELPVIRTVRMAPDALTVSYRSCRPLGQLCLGLIEGCGDHFGTPLEMAATPVDDGLDITVCRPSGRQGSRTERIEALP